MQTRTTRVSRLQAWRLKMGLKIMALGVAVAGKANEQLMRSTISNMKK